MTYQPRTGSVADRAHQILTARGKLAAAALADAIDHDDVSTLMPCLQIAMREGYIKKTRSNGLIWYEVGDGVPPASATDEVDEHPPVHRVVPAGSRPKPAPAPMLPAAKVVAKKPASTVRAPAQDTEIKFTVHKELRLVIEQGDHRLVLDKADVGRLQQVIEEAQA